MENSAHSFEIVPVIIVSYILLNLRSKMSKISSKKIYIGVYLFHEQKDPNSFSNKDNHQNEVKNLSF